MCIVYANDYYANQNGSGEAGRSGEGEGGEIVVPLVCGYFDKVFRQNHAARILAHVSNSPSVLPAVPYRHVQWKWSLWSVPYLSERATSAARKNLACVDKMI